MGNKLRDMFDKNKQGYTGRISFVDHESNIRFIKAIQNTNNGISSEVSGFSGIKVFIKDGDNKIPLKQYDNVIKGTVSPPIENIEVTVSIDCGERKLKFIRQKQNDEIVLWNVEGKGAEYKIIYNENAEKMKVNYKAVYDQVDNLDELIDYHNTLFYFTKKY